MSETGTNVPDAKVPVPDITPVTTVASQTRTSFIGESIGFACSLGAVYLTERACPELTRQANEKLAERLGTWRHTNAAKQKAMAEDVVDFAIMNVAGLVNMASQFAIRRHSQKPDERPPLGYELGRLATGRFAGTVTAAGALAFMKTNAPRLMNENTLLGKGPKNVRFAELALSNLVMSLGALGGNVPAQLLYDRLVGNEKTR
jgi:hypothetical protein